MRLVALLLCLAFSHTALAGSTHRFTGNGFSIQLPADWDAERDLMGVPLMARPARTDDAEGWGSDLLTVTREAVDVQRTCLEGFTYRKLEQISYHAAPFRKLEQADVTLGGKPAVLLTLAYTEGSREIMAYVLILQDGKHMLTATALSSPARFELKRAAFRQTLESLRPR